MTSTFRLIKAEFKKIFKKPSVYIMALFIVLTIFLSLYIFQPIEAVNHTISYGDNLRSQDYYNYFFNEDLATTEIGINKVFDNTTHMINYFIKSNARDHNLSDYYNTIVNEISTVRNTKDSQLRNKYYDNLKKDLNNFYNSFQNFSSLDEYPHIEYTQNNTKYQNDYSKTIKELINISKQYDSYEIIEYWDNNDIQNSLKSNLNNSLNYISPTIYSISQEIKGSYDLFNTYYEDGSRYLSNLDFQKNKMLEHTNTLDKYLETLLEFEFPLVLINKSKIEEINSVIDVSIEALNSFHNVGNPASFSEYANLKTKLDSVDYANYFINTFNLNNTPIYQVKLTNTELEVLEKVQKKVESNKSEIKDKIKQLKDEETIKNIQFKITEYSLLSSAYNSYISDTIILNISERFPNHEFAKMYGFKLDEFNKYQYTERITTNRYYIYNNVYSNSFNTIFTFEQNSSTSGTNVYDFMYFTLELCNVIILVFSMLLICGLVAGETDTGTIKLLLVRPFKRSKILTAKLFATIFFVITFMLFSGILSFAAGYYTYGFTTTEVLTIFNSATVLVMSPLALMGINILCLTLEIIFYIFVALMISTICRNHAGSIYISLILLLIVYVLNVLFGGAFWYSFLPGANLHLFKYFGNSFTPLNSTVLQSVLITPIQSTMTFLYSALLNTLYIVITVAIAYSVFKKRDF